MSEHQHTSFSVAACGNATRRVGFELECASISLEAAADAVKHVFGGTSVPLSSAEIEVEKCVLPDGTNIGTFRIELDAEPVKKMAARFEQEYRQKGDANDSAPWYDDAFDSMRQWLDEVTASLASKIVPVEIVTPPLPISALDELEKLRKNMRASGAEGTKAAFQHAFGLHINPEVDESKQTPEAMVAVMRAFAYLYPWLKQQHSVDFSRRLTPYLGRFEDAFVQKISADDYCPDMETLIRDYHHFHPTRNRALDMLPLFAHVAPDLVRSLYGSDEKINARPTYHYRLPNCEISNASWTVKQEWLLWRQVEKVAANREHLKVVAELWQQQQTQGFTLLHRDDYTRELESFLESINDVYEPA